MAITHANNQQPMNKDTITTHSIFAAAKACSDRGLHRVSLKLRKLAEQCERGEINPEQAIAEYRRIESEHKLSPETKRRIALHFGPKPERKRDLADFDPMTVLVLITGIISLIIAIAFHYLP